ncbi:hypothetical protein M404DRAFT_995027 [Pisolithus tinctorius Marx 270]|uniref:Uncharacterized protein n=1 Tax=Pisolithus tinctorius Marx 270 TaxID=870435 RepID=A0A0C3KP92_PISTI|nr:hypothetical protein M404DRAFT_995027 [Pisolithus tinctorius Marx 270]
MVLYNDGFLDHVGRIGKIVSYTAKRDIAREMILNGDLAWARFSLVSNKNSRD